MLQPDKFSFTGVPMSSTVRGDGDGDGNGWGHLTDAESLELVERFKAGDADAFEQLYMGWAKRVYGFVVMALRNRERAEEITHDVFLSVLASLGEFEPRSETAFRGWLFRIARNKVLTLRRKEQRFRFQSLDETEEEELPPAVPPTENAIGWVQDPDLFLLMELLPEPQRLALFLRFSLDLTAKEAGEIMDRSPADVGQLQHRALRRLERQLDRVGHRNFRRRRSAVLKRIKPLPVLGARRFALENSLRPLGNMAMGMSAHRRMRW
jgi:RNA polymerase sigma-70 factor (ECF subfamily)